MRIGQKIMVSAYLKPDKKESLDKISKALDKPTAEIVREGIDLAIRKYERKQTKK